jgi:predicted enzyme related to lactoylglutathione lyase
VNSGAIAGCFAADYAIVAAASSNRPDIRNVPISNESAPTVVCVIAPSLNLLVLRATDPDQTTAFYASLGLVFGPEKHGNGPAHQSAQIGSTVIEVYPATADGDATRGTTGDIRLGFDVDDFDTAVAAAGRVGTVVTPPTPRDGRVVAVLADPDGRRVEVSSRGS